MADIKDRILSLRNEKELTQEKMAKIFNVGLSTVSMWERGERIPRPKILQEICDYFNVDMDYLMGRSDIKNRYQAGLKYDWEEDKSQKKENNIFSKLTDEELAKLEKFNNMSTVMFMNEGNDISDKDKETLATAYAEVLISQRKKWCIMTSKFIIEAALKLRREYGNIYNLIRDKGIILKYVDLDSSIRGLSVDNVIFVNSNISNFEKDFVIAHEFGHYEFHDDSIRQFSKIEAFKGSREETQANLFATIFLQANYKDCDNDDEIQKIINYIWCNYLIFK